MPGGQNGKLLNLLWITSIEGDSPDLATDLPLIQLQSVALP